MEDRWSRTGVRYAAPLDTFTVSCGKRKLRAERSAGLLRVVPFELAAALANRLDLPSHSPPSWRPLPLLRRSLLALEHSL